MRRSKRLLVTMTGEPVQPVRLYYQIPNQKHVLGRLSALESVDHIPERHQLEWLYCSETRVLKFGPRSYDEVPKKVQPIVLGRIRFPGKHTMRIDVRSHPRAVEVARFFSPVLSPKVVATHARVLNRLSDESLGPLDKIDSELDHDVKVINPDDAERELKRDLEGVRTPEELEHRMAELLERKRNSGEDVPLVEHFPLAPEEETPEFRDLENALVLRFIRAWEHRRGNTRLTLTEIIARCVERRCPGNPLPSQ